MKVLKDGVRDNEVLKESKRVEVAPLRGVNLIVDNHVGYKAVYYNTVYISHLSL